MWTAASALVCALTVLNRSEATFPRIEILDVAPAYVSVGTEAFVRHRTNTIYLIASSAVMRDAAGRHEHECGDRVAVKKLASILIHEEWHLKHGADEQQAYQRQLTALTELGAVPAPVFIATSNLRCSAWWRRAGEAMCSYWRSASPSFALKDRVSTIGIGRLHRTIAREPLRER